MTASAAGRVTPPGSAAAAAGPGHVALVVAHLGDGGAERVVSLLARHWSRAGTRVSVITLSAPESDFYRLPPEVERVGLGLIAPTHGAVEALRLTGRRVAALRRALAARRPDVVLSFTAQTSVLSLLAAAGLGLPVLVAERTDPRQEATPRFWKTLRRILYPRAAGVVVQTESVAAGWARSFCRRVHVMPNFVERPPRLAEPGGAATAHELVAVGRLSHEKGFDLLVEAFARVAGRHPDWTLTVLGEGGERAALEALVARHGLAQRVSLPGRTTEVAARLAAAHAFALPSRYEGFPNSLLEAMACGLPVVAFDCRSGPADIVTDGVDGLLVPAGDVGALAAALDRLMASADDRARLGARARRVADVFSPERILERWSVLLREVGGAR